MTTSTIESPAARQDRQTRLAVIYREHPERREEVVRQLLPLARHLARRYKRGEEPLEDLVQVASVGLLKALTRFDPIAGRSFAAYAVPTITGELRRHYRDTGWAVHVPRAMQELAQKVKRAERSLTSPAGVPPTIADISDHLGVSQEEVSEARIAGHAMRSESLEEPGETIRSHRSAGQLDAGYDAAEHRAALSRLTAGLPERDRLILSLRFGADRSQREIGEAIGVSQMQISRELRRIQRDLSALAESA